MAKIEIWTDPIGVCQEATTPRCNGLVPVGKGVESLVCDPDYCAVIMSKAAVAGTAEHPEI